MIASHPCTISGGGIAIAAALAQASDMTNLQNYCDSPQVLNEDVGLDTLSVAELATEITDLQSALDEMLSRVKTFLGQ